MAEFLTTLFVFGNIWFWLIGVVAFGVLIAFAEYERNWSAGILTIAFISAMVYFNNLTINWNLTLMGLVLYFIIGLLMTYVKWITMLKKRAYAFTLLKESFGDKHPELNISETTDMKAELTEEMYKKFISHLRLENFINSNHRRVIPRVRDFMDKLVSWALWWPAVIFWSFLNDYIRGAFEWSIASMRKWYDNIAQKVFSNVGFSIKDNDDLTS